MKAVGISENGLWMIQNKETGEAEEFTDNMLTDDKYHQYLGNAIPKFNVGWSNTLRYKNFDLSMQFTGQFGFKILNEARAYYENNAVTYYHFPSNNLRMSASELQKVQLFRTFSLQHSSNGYTVPLKENHYVKNLYLYLSGDNLFTITSYSGLYS